MGAEGAAYGLPALHCGGPKQEGEKQETAER